MGENRPAHLVNAEGKLPQLILSLYRHRVFQRAAGQYIQLLIQLLDIAQLSVQQQNEAGGKGDESASCRQDDAQDVVHIARIVEQVRLQPPAVGKPQGIGVIAAQIIRVKDKADPLGHGRGIHRIPLVKNREIHPLPPSKPLAQPLDLR